MKTNSEWLNPFQPFPERDDTNDGKDDGPSTAIEDNLSRSVVSALANAEDTAVLFEFLQALAEHGSSTLRERIKKIAEVIRNCETPEEVEFGLQTWPTNAVEHRDHLSVVLIGVSSSHTQAWTHDQRFAPRDPRPDAWVYIPHQALVVFEFKNDEHPLDATQISAYAHDLGLLQPADNVPRAVSGSCIGSAEAAIVQEKCRDLVLDVPWSAVSESLKRIAEAGSSRGRWLCGQAATYIGWHIRPPYEGLSTILSWLFGPDSPDRREHLRTLVGKLGDSLGNSNSAGAITFAKNDAGRWNIQPDVEPGVYVNLWQNGQPLKSTWLGRDVEPVLWFGFSEIEDRQLIGLSYYLQASGSHAIKRSDAAWNEASSRHLGDADPFEQAVEEWCRTAPTSCWVTVSAVKFKGKKRNWQGGGDEDIESPEIDKASPQEALAFLKQRREELWKFPRIGTGKGEVATIEEASRLVRKPAISLQSQLDFGSGEDIADVQRLLQSAVASISTQRVSDSE
ncbi:MAG: hypothetical protein O3C40_24385 [Planctomycetota bacterium]|nr:hypothetical protein [Planctomycetota bacterium]